MPVFAIKDTPSGDKLRGGYYTPEPVARFLATWVSVAGPTVLEPSCGDGAILRELTQHGDATQVLGVELFPEEADKARLASGARVIAADFFTWFTAEHRGRFDGAAGNPPYIRFGSWEEPYRTPALDLMRSEGMRPTKLTNAWVPFVVASILAVRDGGRIGLVLPAELLQVGYASALRSYLVDRCLAITVVSFDRLLFPGVLQEVVLLLAERGEGPAAIRTVEVGDASALTDLGLTAGPAVRAQLHETEKWTKYYLDTEQIDALRSIRTDARLPHLGRWAEVDVGVVTGRNSFFCMSRADSDARRLTPFTIPLVARSSQLPGLTFTAADFDDQEEAGARTRLLALNEGTSLQQEPYLQEYIEAGAADGVPSGYKCRIRRNWWQVPSIWIPDGFMLRQIHHHPRLIANTASATSTDTVHRVRVRSGVEMQSLAVAAFNSFTFAAAEVIGRSYGGGILELEPSEAEELPVPSPTLVPKWLSAKADELAREGRLEDAMGLVDDNLLVDRLGFSPQSVLLLRSAWQRLQRRRTTRGKSSRR